MTLRELLKDCLVQANAAFEILDRKILIWRMRAAIRQRESHQQRFDTKDAAKLRDDRNAAAFAYERDVAIESFAQRALCCFAERRMRIGEIPWAAVTGGDFHRHAFGQVLS